MSGWSLDVAASVRGRQVPVEPSLTFSATVDEPGAYTIVARPRPADADVVAPWGVRLVCELGTSAYRYRLVNPVRAVGTMMLLSAAGIRVGLQRDAATPDLLADVAILDPSQSRWETTVDDVIAPQASSGILRIPDFAFAFRIVQQNTNQTFPEVRIRDGAGNLIQAYGANDPNHQRKTWIGLGQTAVLWDAFNGTAGASVYYGLQFLCGVP